MTFAHQQSSSAKKPRSPPAGIPDPKLSQIDPRSTSSYKGAETSHFGSGIIKPSSYVLQNKQTESRTAENFHNLSRIGSNSHVLRNT